MVATSVPELPLGMAGDEVVYVTRVKGSSDLRQHLAELGFVEGAQVKVISHAGGDCIITLKGSRLGVSKSMATHVMVSPVSPLG